MGAGAGSGWSNNPPVDLTKTYAAMTLYVDASAGNDGNTGLASGAGGALATLGAALAKVPLRLGHDVTISVAAGTYTESNVVYFIPTAGGNLNITGSSWTAVTPATGIASGTFDASFAGTTYTNTCKATGAGWTASDLVGKFCKITSGTRSGQYFPIASNNAADLDLSMNCANSGFQSQTFEIVEPAAVFARSGSTSYILSVSGESGKASTLTASTLTGFCTIENIKFNTTGSPAASVVVESSVGNVRLKQCTMNTALPSGSPFRWGIAATGQGVIKDSFILASTNGATAINPGNLTSFSVDGLVVKGPGGGAGSAFSTSTDYLKASVSGNGLYVYNCGSAFSLVGGILRSVLTTAASGRLLLRNCTTGIACTGGNTQIYLASNVSNIEINTCTDGLKTTAGSTLNSGGLANSGTVSASLNGVIIKNCTDAIDLQTSHNQVSIAGAAIDTNSAWGVNMAGSKYAGYNQVMTSGTTAMSSNTSGDFTLDGTTATSLATLQGDADKTIVDATWFNRLAEP